MNRKRVYNYEWLLNFARRADAGLVQKREWFGSDCIYDQLKYFKLDSVEILQRISAEHPPFLVGLKKTFAGCVQ